MSRTAAHSLPTPQPGQRWAVFGMGATGLSCARYLQQRGVSLLCVDTRIAPPLRERIAALSPAIELLCGGLPEDCLLGCAVVVVSPGVPLDHPALVAARESGVILTGDIQLFASVATAPVIGITGSNGKSTVTTLVWRMLEQGGRRVAAGGNLGTPALDLLGATPPDFFVLELSSFQLELTRDLSPAVACVLNLSADHLDRHGSLAGYAAAKARLLEGASVAVLNLDDPEVAAMAGAGQAVRWFGRETGRYHLEPHQGGRWLWCGDEPVMATAELALAGRHNELNALAALAVTDAVGLERAAQCATLRSFEGLDHRCRRIASHAGIDWFDDSKGTNIGATCAALEGLLSERWGVLIAGGQGKGADFRELRPYISGRVHTVIVLGEDAQKLADALEDLVPIERADSLPEAVRLAAAAARPGEAVLLSPACASLDMFENYQHRGRVFAAAVREVTGT